MNRALSTGSVAAGLHSGQSGEKKKGIEGGSSIKDNHWQAQNDRKNRRNKWEQMIDHKMNEEGGKGKITNVEKEQRSEEKRNEEEER